MSNLLTPMLTRKEFLTAVLTTAAASAMPISLPQGQTEPAGEITLEDLKAMMKIAGLEFTDQELKGILQAVQQNKQEFEALRAQSVDYTLEPPISFRPLDGRPSHERLGYSASVQQVTGLRKPAKEEDLAFLSVRELGYLIRTRQLSPVDLTELCLKRLQTYGDKLLCLITLTPELARQQAKQAEEEIRAGKYRGPLHGIPCGVKDLCATKGIPTTWGAEPYKDQVFDYDATVVEKLRKAGAVLCAKLSMGALAQGDVWFKGRTRNPWNPAQGSSGSSAGSCASVAAGLLPFAIGTETLGSICSPSLQCRVTGLRPTYGRVSRHGAMAVSWTMDKLGPICRYAEDCALVFAAIAGHDPLDRTSIDKPFHYRNRIDLSKLKIGFLIAPNGDLKDLSRLEKDDYLKALVSLGAKPVPIKFTPLATGVLSVLTVEAGAAFDDFTRSDMIQHLHNSAWPATYRESRFVPAVEYIRAQRLRRMVMEKFEQEFGDFDMFVGAGIAGYTLQITNLTGHPQVVVPNGTDSQGNSKAVSLVGRLYEEAPLLAVANQLQQKLGHTSKRPDLSHLPDPGPTGG